MERLKKDARSALIFISVSFITIYVSMAMGFLPIARVPFNFNEPYKMLLEKNILSLDSAHFYVSINLTIFIVTAVAMLYRMFQYQLRKNMIMMLSKTATLLTALAPFFFIWAFGNIYYTIPHELTEWKRICVLLLGLQGIVITYSYLIFVVGYKYALELQKDTLEQLSEEKRHPILMKEAKTFAWLFFKEFAKVVIPIFVIVVMNALLHKGLF